MKKALFYSLLSILIAILTYWGNSIVRPKELIGKYILYNYGHSNSIPNRPDTIKIFDELRFKSSLYGTGNYYLKVGFGITYVHFNTDISSDVLGHTFIKKTLNNEILIYMNKDENIFYKKVE